MSSIDLAITRLQSIALALTTLTDVAGNSITLANAADYPVENVPPFPCAIAYNNGGSFRLTNATIHHNFPVIAVEFHFSRVNLKQAEMQKNAVAIEFPQRLAGDPTLNGTVITIVGGADSDIPYTVNQYFPWGQPPNIYSVMLKFDIPIKLLKSPQATA